MSKVSIEHHGGGYFAISIGGEVQLAVDPWVASQPKRRKMKTDEAEEGNGAQPKYDFVLLSDQAEDAFDDALDVLERSEAVFVSTPSRCDEAARELGGDPDKYMDLVPGESAKCGFFQVTAIGTDGFGPIPAIGEISSTFRGVSRGFGFRAEPPTQITDMLTRLPGLSMFGSLPFGLGSGPKIAYLLDVADGPNVLVAGESFAGRPDLAMLDELSELGEADVLVAAAEGDEVTGLVWAVRELGPKVVLLYRKRDPYGLGARRPSLPIRRFIEALEEDSPDTKVVFLRKGVSHES